MIDELVTLRAILFEKLLTTPSEEKERKQYLKQIVAREMKSSETGRKLQEELKRAIDDKENEVHGTVQKVLYIFYIQKNTFSAFKKNLTSTL